MENIRLIKVERSTAEMLKQEKISPRESYDEIIKRLLILKKVEAPKRK